MKLFQKIANAVHKISNVFAWVGTVALFFMMLLTFIDVLGRYIFNKPVIGAQDVVEQLMVVLVFTVLGQVTIDRIHIRADVLNPVLSVRNYCIISAISFGIAAAVVILMAWQTGIQAWKHVLNLNLVTGVISMPLAPFYVITSLGLALCFLEMAFDIAKYLVESKGTALPKEVIER